MRVEGADLSSPDLQGAGQRIDGNIVEIVDAQKLVAGPGRRRSRAVPERRSLSSKATILTFARRPTEAVGSAVGTRARAEALTRFVNSTVQKKPTVSLPSAREVLRTRIGDCNEHTALFVAMSRAAGIPARIAVGLAYVRGAFYYHAWPEIYIDEGAARGFWLPVDPTFNQFPADATHFRLARGGLDKQAAIHSADRPRQDHDDRSRSRRRTARRFSSESGTLDRRADRAPDVAAPVAVVPAVLPGRSPMISIQNLRKQYGSFTAVDGVDLDVNPGEIHGFLGPNGAGKTTSIRMIAGLLKPTSGRIVVNGHDLAANPEAAKASLGFIPDRPYIYEKLTAGEFLRFHAGLYGMNGNGLDQRVREMLDLFELGRWENELVESFSHGMKQRLVMCAAFLHRPQAVLVDEPMVGLDPRGAKLIKSVFRRMSEHGVAILMSTHTLEVAQEMCDRISIILKGKIIARGTVDELRAMAGSQHEELTPVFLKLTGGSALQELDEIV